VARRGQAAGYFARLTGTRPASAPLLNPVTRPAAVTPELAVEDLAPYQPPPAAVSPTVAPRGSAPPRSGAARDAEVAEATTAAAAIPTANPSASAPPLFRVAQDAVVAAPPTATLGLEEATPEERPSRTPAPIGEAAAPGAAPVTATRWPGALFPLLLPVNSRPAPQRPEPRRDQPEARPAGIAETSGQRLAHAPSMPAPSGPPPKAAPIGAEQAPAASRYAAAELRPAPAESVGPSEAVTRFQPTAPAAPTIHIGVVEVRAPAPLPPSIGPRAARSASGPVGSLSRGFGQRFGFAQS
jgi:hypothetical protein